MQLNPPNKNIFIVSIILVVFAAMAYNVPQLRLSNDAAFWMAILGYVVLCVGLVIKKA
jgi:hypothetical protein